MDQSNSYLIHMPSPLFTVANNGLVLTPTVTQTGHDMADFGWQTTDWNMTPTKYAGRITVTDNTSGGYTSQVGLTLVDYTTGIILVNLPPTDTFPFIWDITRLCR
jgi:hypothetical protein